MTKFAVDPVGLGEVIEALRNANLAIAAELDRLDVAVSVLEGQWSGEARDAYVRAQRAAHAQLVAMNQALASAHRAGGSVVRRYAEAQHTVATVWGVQ